VLQRKSGGVETASDRHRLEMNWRTSKEFGFGFGFFSGGQRSGFVGQFHSWTSN